MLLVGTNESALTVVLVCQLYPTTLVCPLQNQLLRARSKTRAEARILQEMLRRTGLDLQISIPLRPLAVAAIFV